MGLIAWIVLGALAGFLANLVMGGRTGILGTIVLGIIGALVGGFLAGAVMGVGDITGLNIESVLVAAFGAIVVIFVARALTGGRSSV